MRLQHCDGPNDLTFLVELCIDSEERKTLREIESKYLRDQQQTQPFSIMNNVNHARSPSSNDDIRELIYSMKTELTNKIGQIENRVQNTNRPRQFNRGNRNGPKNFIDLEKMQGYCLNFLRNKCSRGEGCRYKHDPAPSSVLDYVASITN